MTRRRIVIVVGVVVPAVSVLVGIVTGPAATQGHWPGWLEYLRVHPWQSLIVLTIISVGLAGLATQGPPEPLELRTVADRLADAVRRDLNYEAQRRALFDPYPLPVRWDAAPSDLVVGWPSLIRIAAAWPGGSGSNSGDWANGPTDLAGSDRDLADVVRKVPTGRLVVLGDKGSGKTILLVRLVLELLDRRRTGDPVPILLPLASWNPTEEDLRSWIVRWLITDRTGLGGPTELGGRHSVARALMESGMILPVLDGFDEIPQRVRGAALAGINEAMQPGLGLILAARTDDYRVAVQPNPGINGLLACAAGIELRPLAVGVVANYLTDSAGAASRWDQVIATFSAVHPPPAAEALRTPLMVALARIAYNPWRGEDLEAMELQPVELLDPELFPSRQAVEAYMFDRFISACYRNHPNPSHPSRRYRWNAMQAERWLAFLARHLEQDQGGSTDLAWWKLPGAAPRHLPGVAAGLTVALVVGVGYPFVGFGVGLTVGLLSGLIARWRLRPGPFGLARGVAGGVIGGNIGALVSLFSFGFDAQGKRVSEILASGIAVGVGTAVLARFLPALVGGLVGALTTSFYENAHMFEGLRTEVGFASHLINAFGAGLAVLLLVEMVGRTIPARGFRWSPIWFASGLACALAFGFITWVQAGWIAGLIVGLAGTIASGLVGGIAQVAAPDLAGGASPDVVLRRDRMTFLASVSGLGIASGIAAGLMVSLGHLAWNSNVLRHAFEVGITTVLAAGLAFGFVHARWGSFTLARWYLAVSGRLPWRLMTFLRDAYVNRGVLRQVGGIYQFRHIEVQRNLLRERYRFGSDAAVRAVRR